MMHVIRFGDRVRCEATLTDRYGVYLDTDTLIELAKGSTERRTRFITALRNRGTLLFSMTNVVEVGGLRGRSASTVAAFLASVGRLWIPLEMNFLKVVDRERAGHHDAAPVWDSFMKAFVEDRRIQVAIPTTPSEAEADAFFDLGAVVAWSQDARDDLRQESEALSQSVRALVARLRAAYDRDRSSLDGRLPPIAFAPERRTEFVMTHLLRGLVVEAKARQFQKNDALDLCHAVMAAAFAGIAALDKAWKRRVSMLPRPCTVARVFYRPEADQLVTLLEQLVTAEPSL